MTTENDYSVRQTGAGHGVWGVVPVSDQPPNGRARRGAKRKVRRRGKKPPPADAGEGEGEGRPDDDEHTVDHLA